MGYYTSFALTHDSDNIDDNDLAQELVKLSGYSWDNELTLPGVKWYSHQEDMVKLSNLHKGTLFTLEGNGEIADDLWVCYYKTGLSQKEKAVITFAPFDESKLK